jgi:hypothetical protein
LTNFLKVSGIFFGYDFFSEFLTLCDTEEVNPKMDPKMTAQYGHKRVIFFSTTYSRQAETEDVDHDTFQTC